ncbi:MAG TPA: ABC transporter ATP-binding protein [Patescibacteria group bacterium]|nr:ABC transporter ATP-binding protein [Patescibacteria group bacterium]
MNGETRAIDVRRLTKKFGDKIAVDHVDIAVPRGKIYGFLGPNGSGKTTTMRMICGLLTPDDGEGTCLGFDIRTQAAEIKRRIGYMTQRFSYWEDLTIRENLKFVATIYGLDRIDARVDDALASLGLTDRAAQLAGELSGGWKQRMALAACILHEPELLLLDEPTAGVDPKARREFWDEIHRLAARGITILVSTHYMDEAERCHAIIYMAYGHVVTQGSVKDVLKGAGLDTWVVKGPGLIALMHELEKEPAVATVAPFGDSLHVSGTDPAALAATVEKYRTREGYSWQKSEPSFEDVFIRYMSATADTAGRNINGR